MEDSEVKKVLARVASNQVSTNQTEESRNFHLHHDHQYTSVKRNHQQQQDEDEMTGDDDNSIITLSSTQSVTSDLITRHAARNALKTLRTRNLKNSLPFKVQTPNKSETKHTNTKKK